MDEKNVYQDIAAAFEYITGEEIVKAVPIRRGWMNKKWKVSTVSGDYFLKQLHQDRYRSQDREDLLYALKLQQLLQHIGFPCPELIGDPIHLSSKKESFVIMTFSEGETLSPESFEVPHMKELGTYTAAMHNLLNCGRAERLPKKTAWVPESRSERAGHWKNVMAGVRSDGNTELLPIIDHQLSALENIDPQQFTNCPKGWAHRDLWTDNLLFQGAGLSAILDFDRMRFDTLLLDVGRAIISCSLDSDGSFRYSLAEAFFDAYQEEIPLESHMLELALKMIWYMESPWWIHSRTNSLNTTAARFAAEMEWLAGWISSGQPLKCYANYKEPAREA